MDYFDDVHAQTGPDSCAKCKKQFIREDRVTEIKIVAGVGSNPNARGECLYVSNYEEYAHLGCVNKSEILSRIEIPRSALVVTKDIPPLHARFHDYICNRCKKKFVRGDRVLPVLLVEGMNRDPQTGGKAVQCSGEYEMAHVDCNDTQLTGGS